MMQKYPEEITPEEFDSTKWDFAKQFGLDDDRPTNQIVQQVKEFAQKTGGQIYTQVDGETDRVYSRGLRFVNRTGLYEIVKLEDIQLITARIKPAEFCKRLFKVWSVSHQK